VTARHTWAPLRGEPRGGCVRRTAALGLTLALRLALCLPAAALAVPYTPANDNEVVERLPASTRDPLVRQVESLRKQLTARPDDTALRLEIARRYFDLAMAQGDPRYVGYASAAIAPLANTAKGDAGYWVTRGLIQQYGHNFTGALESLAKARALDPANLDATSWRAAIHMVQADYDAALSECTRLVPLTHPLHAQGCTAYVQASTGQLAPAYDALAKALGAAGPVAPELALWVRTRLAEMALRLGRADEAQQHFREALALGITDQFLLGAYADFLLQQKKYSEVTTLLADWERSDILLLRLALAARASNDSRAGAWAAQLRERFAAANLRGDRLHEQEAARFELDIEGSPAKALDLATRNYQDQKEPRDAEILMRAAIAAKQPRAAAPAIAWLRDSKYEDPQLAALAARLTTPGVKP
jgi:Tfp pilus assembly protein PilF